MLPTGKIQTPAVKFGGLHYVDLSKINIESNRTLLTTGIAEQIGPAGHGQLDGQDVFIGKSKDSITIATGMDHNPLDDRITKILKSLFDQIKLSEPLKPLTYFSIDGLYGRAGKEKNGETEVLIPSTVSGKPLYVNVFNSETGELKNSRMAGL